MNPTPKISPPTEHFLRRAAEALRQGQLVGLPTETVYGLAADGSNSEAVQAIYRAKGRPSNNPLILHVDTAQKARRLFAEQWSDVEDHRWRQLSGLWPGPLTIIGRKHSSVLPEVTAGGDTVAVRIPAHPIARRLLGLLDFPVAAPSANVSNYVSPTTAQHVADGFGREVAMVIDGGSCEVGLESTIVTLGTEDESATVLRAGGITVEVLTAALGEAVLDSDRRIDLREDQRTETLQAPGQFSQHYSPRTPLILVDADRGEPVPDPRSDAPAERREKASIAMPTADGSDARRILRICFFPPPRPMSGYAEVWVLSSSKNWCEVAANLYAELRRADREGFDRIEIDRCEANGIGRAIADRLSRASRHTS